jgi:hypothetical protein
MSDTPLFVQNGIMRTSGVATARYLKVLRVFQSGRLPEWLSPRWLRVVDFVWLIHCNSDIHWCGRCVPLYLQWKALMLLSTLGGWRCRCCNCPPDGSTSQLQSSYCGLWWSRQFDSDSDWPGDFDFQPAFICGAVAGVLAESTILDSGRLSVL